MAEERRRPEEELDELPFKEQPVTVPELKYNFETVPDPIPTGHIKQTVSAEVVVVGGGLAGVSAAISAAEAGASVALIEMMLRCQARGRDNAFIGSRLQEKLGIEIDKDDLILNMMKFNANMPDQRLLRLWADGSGETADWLMDMTDAAGLEVKLVDYPLPENYDPATEYHPYYLVTHRYDNQPPVIKCMAENALQKGVDFHFRKRARQLLRPDEGRVTGVIAQDEAGDYIQFNAGKAVILCTGDYSHDPEMMAKYCPQAAYLKSFLKTSTGDGHKMAMWIGAEMEPGPHAPITHGFPGPMGTDAFLQVNIKGERFQNEDVSGQGYTNQIERQPGRTAWQVYDSKYPEELHLMGRGFMKFYSMEGRPRGPMGKADVIADSIEELAEGMEVPVETFKATIARYNELARLGKDLDFGKRPDRLTTIEKPPFYAGKGRYAMLAVCGGLLVNPKMQALDKNWDVIPGLYLAGNTMGRRFAVDYPVIAPGISHGMALHFGRLAGWNAASIEP